MLKSHKKKKTKILLLMLDSMGNLAVHSDTSSLNILNTPRIRFIQDRTIKLVKHILTNTKYWKTRQGCLKQYCRNQMKLIS